MKQGGRFKLLTLLFESLDFWRCSRRVLVMDAFGASSLPLPLPLLPFSLPLPLPFSISFSFSFSLPFSFNRRRLRSTFLTLTSFPWMWCVMELARTISTTLTLSNLTNAEPFLIST